MSVHALFAQRLRHGIIRNRWTYRYMSSNPEAHHRPLGKKNLERTFLAIKPDGVQRGLVGDVIKRFECKGFKILGLKIMNVPRSLAEAHYSEHSERAFFERACRFLCSGPVVATVWEGLDVVKSARRICGPTSPQECLPGTIRGDFGQHFRRNLVHSSDSVENASREIDLWFDTECELIDSWDHSQAHWFAELANAPITFSTNKSGDEHPGFLAGKPGVNNEELEFKSTY